MVEKDDTVDRESNGNEVVFQESIPESTAQKGGTITTICLSYSDYESKPTNNSSDEKLPSVESPEQRSLAGNMNLEEIEEKTFKLSNQTFLSINGFVSSTSSIQKIKNTHAIIIFNQGIFSPTLYEKGYGVILDESNGSTEYLI